MQIGALEIQMYADIARLKKDMDDAKKAVGDAMQEIQKYTDLAKKAFIAFAGIASVNAFVGMIRGAIDATGAMKDLATQAAVSEAALGAFKGVAAGTDTSIESVVGALGKMSKSMATADEDSKGAALAVKALGLDMAEFRRLQPEDQLLEVAKAMAEFQDGADKSAAAQAIFGKEGAKLLPFLKDLGEGADEISSKLTEQNKVLKANQAAMSDAFGENLVKARREGEAWKKDVAMGMLPALYELSQAWVDVSTGPGGLKEEISKLAKDGTITEWTRTGVQGLSYLADALQYAARLGKIAFEAIVGIGARMVIELQGMADAGKRLFAGDFSGALDTWRAAVATSARVGQESATKIAGMWSDMWSEETLGQKLRARMAELKGVDAAAQDAKKSLNLKDVLDAQAAADEAAKNSAREAAEAQRRHKAEMEQAAKAGQDLKASIEAKNLAMEAELALGRKLTPVEQELLKLTDALKTGKITLSATDEKAARASIEYGAALEKQIAGITEARKLHEDYVKDIDKRIEQLRRETEQQREANAEIGLTTQQVGELRAAKLELLAVDAEQLAQVFESMDKTSGLIAQQRELAQAYRDRADAIRDGALKQASADTAKQELDAWKKLFEQAGQSLSDALMNGAHSVGKDVVKYFETLAIRVLVQGVLTDTAGALGMSSGASAGAGGTSALGTISNGMSLYRTGTGLAGMASSAVSAYGSLTGSASISAYGAGMGMTSAEAAAAAEAYSAAGMTEIGSSVAAGSSMGGSIAALGPYAAAAIAIYAIAKSLDDSGTPHTGGTAYADALGARTTTGSDIGFMVDRSAGGDALALQTASAVSALLNGVGRINGATGFSVSTGFADDSSDDGAWGELAIMRNGAKVLDWRDTQTSRWAPKEFGDGEEGQKQYLAAVAKDVRVALDGIGLPGWATQMLDKLGDAPSLQDLASVADQIVHTQEVLKSLGRSVAAFNNLSGTAATNLLTAFGGADALVSGMSAYVDATYSDAEKLKLQQQQLADAFAQLGEAMPTSTAELRAMVEAQGAATEADAQLLASLVQLAPAFAAVQKQVDEQTKAAVESVADARSTLVDAYRREADALQSAVDGHREFARSLREFSAGLATSSLSPLSPVEQYRQARLEFDQVDALAQANDPTARARWQDAAQHFLELSRAVNASSDAYTADYNAVRAAAAETATHAQASADVAQLQLDAAQAQVDLLGGIDASATTIADAMTGLRDAVAAALAAGATTAELGPLPSFDVGTNYVPTDMVAQIHRGERIVPAADNAALIDALRNPTSGGNTAALEQLLESVLAELQGLRGENSAGHEANVAATKNSAVAVATAVADGVSRGAHAATLQKKATIQ
jgi:hypothetical protein